MNTVGIYLLHFGNEDTCYIGQSTHIEKRVAEHKKMLKSGNHYNSKLQAAYNTVKLLPTVEILERCSIDELNAKESSYIEEFDSINSGYNITNSGSGGRGIHSSKSKYSEEQILNVFFELTNPDMSNKDISEKLGIPITLVESIAYNKRHAWVSERYPELRQLIDNNIKSNSRFLSSNNIGRRKGNKYCLLDSNNVEYIFDNISEFCRKHNLNKGHVSQVLKGNEMQHKGFRKGVSL